MAASIYASVIVAEAAVVQHPGFTALLPQLLHLVGADDVQALQLYGAQLFIEHLKLLVHTLLVLTHRSTALPIEALGSTAPHLALELQEFPEALALVNRNAQEVCVGVVDRHERLAAEGQVGATERVLAVGQLSAAAQRVGGRGLVIAEVLLLRALVVSRALVRAADAAVLLVMVREQRGCICGAPILLVLLLNKTSKQPAQGEEISVTVSQLFFTFGQICAKLLISHLL